MTYEEMKAYIANMVKSQGSQGAIAIAPLLYAMADKMFADPETGVVPIVVSIAEVGNKRHNDNGAINRPGWVVQTLSFKGNRNVVF